MADRHEAHDSLLKAIQESKEDLLKHIDKKTADIQTSLIKIETSRNWRHVWVLMNTTLMIVLAARKRWKNNWLS